MPHAGRDRPTGQGLPEGGGCGLAPVFPLTCSPGRGRVARMEVDSLSRSHGSLFAWTTSQEVRKLAKPLLDRRKPALGSREEHSPSEAHLGCHPLPDTVLGT